MTAAATEFGVLGPIRVLREGVEKRVGGPRERAVLARLLFDANRVVSVDRLIEAVWHGDPPASARGQIAICVSRLRRALGESGRAIGTASPGYVARLDEGAVDWSRFNALIGRARSRAAGGDAAGAVASYREALGLWRGVPFEDLPGLRAEAVSLQSARLDAVEACAELELRLGLHHRVGKDLAAVVAEHPLRERARAQLMLAQYRSGRRADALRTYQDARRVLVEQIGLEPGPELRELHEQILRDAPALLAAPARVEVAAVAPSQLPRQVLPFAGRSAELAELDAALATGPDVPGAVVLSGPGEVGKTALALRWAHHRLDRFPDGQLHADLVDDFDRPVPPAVLLDRFLRALGVPASSIPDDPGEKVALYRSTVSRKRVLVVLDGAVDHAQVRPLLPSGAHTRVIVTSRHPMDELVARHGAHRAFLEPLRPEESWELLTMLLGRDWVAEERGEASRIVGSADGFPLPLRRAAAGVRSAPHRPDRRWLTGVPA
ncbi:winged helix-turn-helix domain-containing protein [Saccharothrix sp. S26]|uniref:AfsR/SARP family transcriptional regulator n=1 Tax=Saccharothrix sp. S26 TaxID=2907215 RepID=UPI001F2C19BB|nr:AfsR/SARP family transcriptional regulator [Saccharothrix sp. S26]MCE6998498.1 winged helix-turn-helix domain-containing protein [Saccharothrix sp. S26]